MSDTEDQGMRNATGERHSAAHQSGSTTAPRDLSEIQSVEPHAGSAATQGAPVDESGGRDCAGAGSNPDTQVDLHAEACALVTELRVQLDDASKYLDHGDDQASAEEWASRARDIRDRLRVLFKRWDWTEPFPDDDETKSVLQTCAFPGVVSTRDGGLGMTEGSTLWSIDEPEERADLLQTLRDLDLQLADQPGSEFQALRDSAVLRYIQARYGLRRFVERLDTTLAIGRCLQNMIPMLSSMAAMGVASTRPSFDDLSGFALLALSRLQIAIRHIDELRSRSLAVETELEQEQESHRDTRSALLVRVAECAAATAQTQSVVDERDQARSELDRLEEENKRLKRELKAQRREVTELQAKVTELDDQVTAGSKQGVWTDALLDQVYQFTWQHARVAGDADVWYSLLRAAATGSSGDVPAGITTMLTSNNNTATWPAAPAMTSLRSFRSIDGATLPTRPRLVVQTQVSSGTTNQARSRERGQTLDLTWSEGDASGDPDDESRKRTPTRGAKRNSDGLVQAQLRQTEDSNSSSEETGTELDSSDDEESGDEHEHHDPDVRPRPGPIKVHLPLKVYKSCVTPPSCPSGEAVTMTEFIQEDLPFTLAPAQGGQRSQDSGDGRRGHDVLPELPADNDRDEGCHESSGCDRDSRLEEFWLTKPWDQMWSDRIKHFFLFDPNQCLAHQVDWLEEVFKLMFEYREAYWTIGHWLAISKSDTDESYPEWYVFYKQRAGYIKEFRDKAQALANRRLAGMTDLVWSEPAVWMAANNCSWIPADPERGKTCEEEVATLDKLEPIRARWTTAPGRFVEALLPEQLELLDQHRNQSGRRFCWAIPAPFNSSDLEVFESMVATASFKDFAKLGDRRKSAARRKLASSGKGKQPLKSKKTMNKRRRLELDCAGIRVGSSSSCRLQLWM